jgi:hypothetical protein
VNPFHQHIGCQEDGSFPGSLEHTAIISNTPDDVRVPDETAALDAFDEPEFTNVL